MAARITRRTMVGAGMAAGVTAWAATSSSWSARFLRERFGEWGRDVPAAPQRPAPTTWDDNRITLAWLGHATVLINFRGLRIITDPVLYPRIGVDLGVGSLGPLRLVQCALTPAELPDIDLVLVSHAHFDHLDTPSLASIPGRPVAVMASGTSDLLPRRHYRAVHELRWNDHVTVQTARGDALVRGL
ncbi:MAG: MBL fold metallo-hydrolase, partial [Acidobacteria bacterium]|nr:MBL fold metallo-hydrolase [Acidobacteriota bacterium]